MKREHSIKLALVLFGLTLALMLAECSVRLLSLDPEIVHVDKGRYRLSANPKIGYEPVPALDYTGKSLHFYDYHGQSNKLGFRDRDHELSKPPGTTRVLVIGDSIAAGQSVRDNDEIFPVVLEQLLKETPETYEVLNFGVSGYNTEQEVETLRVKGLQFSPDIVVVSYCLNDRERNDGGILQTLIAESKGKNVSNPESSWLHRSALYRLVYYRVLKRRRIRPKDYSALSNDTVADSFGVLAAMAKKSDFKVLVAVFPDLLNINEYERDDEHAYVRGLSEEHGFTLVDLKQAMGECGGRIHHDRYHPTARGHSCAARALMDAVSGINK